MKPALVSAVAILAAAGASGEAVPYSVHGSGWTEVGRIMHSSDTLGGTAHVNLSHVPLQGMGGQLVLRSAPAPGVDVSLGVGVYRSTHTLGSDISGNEPIYWANSVFKAYVSQARFTYSRGGNGSPGFGVTLGSFPYDYHPDVRNLGLYLLRGPVYPGLLAGGFGEVDSTRSNMLGLRLHGAAGNFSQDIILKMETEPPPTFDWSLAFVAKYRAVGALEFGAGVNFYRVLPYNRDLETPGRLPSGFLSQLGKENYIDTVGGDTTFYTHQGVKLMLMLSLDLKSWIPLPSAGPDEFKLYGEAAVLGVKDYGAYYGDIRRRIPVMAGFNLPTFGLLDWLSLEVEWYGSPYRNDLAHLGSVNYVTEWQPSERPLPSPVPAEAGAYADSTRDNWKWSLGLRKTVKRRIRIDAQVANDHYRPRPLAIGQIAQKYGTAEAMTTPRDWYIMGRVGFLF